MQPVLLHKKPLRLLVTGAGGPAGINAIRLLSTLPDPPEVYATDMDPTAAGQFFAKSFALSSPCSEKVAYQENLHQLITQWEIDIVLPTVSEELVVIREALQRTNAQLILSPQETIETCHDKRKLYAKIQTMAPEMLVPWTTADQTIWQADSYFLKPAFGRGAKGCRLIDASELAFLQSKQLASDWIMMEVLPGKEYTVDAYIDQSGKAAYIVPRERLQLSGGISSKGRTIHHEEITRLTERILALLPGWGPVCVQWKIDKHGKPKLLEINPRLSGAVTITACAGANPMACLLEDMEHGTVETVNWKEVTVVRYFEDHLL